MKLNPKILAKYNIENEIIYPNTNEDLTTILESFNIKGKDVLTVLASSDQLLSFYHYEAKTIDTFDRAYSTLYYYYLRKWLILYKDIFSIKGFDLRCINELIKSVNPSCCEEYEATLFWKKYFKCTNYQLGHLFNLFSDEGDVPYYNDADIKNIFNSQLTFNYMDIAKPIDIDKKYDIIYLSNLMEYLTIKDSRNTIRKNLENLLNPDGIAVLTYKMSDEKNIWHQREVYELTENNLTYEHINNLVYTYKKR